MSYMKKIFTHIAIVASIIFAFSAHSALADRAALAYEERLNTATLVVENLINRVQIFLATNPTPIQVRNETNALIELYFDYNIISRFAAGQAWRGASAQEKTAYRTAFREVLLSLAETQFEVFRNLEYTSIDSVAKGEKLVVVHGRIHDISGKIPDSIISWRLTTNPNRPIRIIDIEVENISMLITQQQENAAVIRQNGGDFTALITSLQTKAHAIKAKNTP